MAAREVEDDKASAHDTTFIADDEVNFRPTQQKDRMRERDEMEREMRRLKDLADERLRIAEDRRERLIRAEELLERESRRLRDEQREKSELEDDLYKLRKDQQRFDTPRQTSKTSDLFGSHSDSRPSEQTANTVRPSISKLLATPQFKPNPLAQPADGDRPRGLVKWTLTFDRQKTTLRNFITYFQTFAQLNEYDESQKCHQLLKSFGADAMRIVQRLQQNYGYQDLIVALYEYYEPVESRQTKQIQLGSLTRNKGEDARDFANRVQDLVNSCFATLCREEQDEMVVAKFINGHDMETMRDLLPCRFTSIDHAVNHMKMLEAKGVVNYSKEKKTKETTTEVTPTQKVTAANAAVPELCDRDSGETEPNEGHEAEIDAIIDVCLAHTDLASLEYEDEVFEELAARVYRRYPQARKPGKCFYCGVQGHAWMKCYKLLATLQRNGYKGALKRPPRPARQSPNKQPQYAPRRTDSASNDNPSHPPFSRFFRSKGRRDSSYPKRKRFPQSAKMFETMLEMFQDMDADDSDSEVEECDKGAQTEPLN